MKLAKHNATNVKHNNPSLSINMSYQIVSEKEITRWNFYIENATYRDFYHTSQYHTLQNSGEPFLFVYEKNGVFIVFPLLKRRIEQTDYVDFTSVYGYSGPISNKEFAQLDSDLLDDFKTQFLSFIDAENCVSIFARLNPFANQQLLLEKFGGVHENGKTVYMDLTVPLEDQRSRYEKRLRRRIKQLRRKDYRIIEATNSEEVQLFIQLYYENMDRVNASEHYYFDKEYFLNLLDKEKFLSRLLLIFEEEILICGAVVINSDSIIRNHLSATNVDYLKESPSKLLTDEISLIGRELGLKYFHLGGGVGGKEDSLFYYKSSFSNLFLEDKVWCYIADHAAYDSLVNLNADRASPKKRFPLYRT